MAAEMVAPVNIPRFGHTSFRFTRAMELASRVVIGNTSSLRREVDSLENLVGIPQHAPIILAVSHLSDTDLPIAGYALADRFDIAVTNQSTQHSLRSGGILHLGVVAAGQNNFYPITYEEQFADGKKRIVAGRFNPDDYLRMVDGLGEGKAIAIAAHNPSHEEEPTLARHGGMAVPFLAELAQAVIIPVGVVINRTNGERRVGMAETMAQDIITGIRHPSQKPHAHVFIGRPLFPQGRDREAEHYASLLRIQSYQQRRDERLKPEQEAELQRLQALFRDRSSAVMRELARILPQSARGVWQQVLGQETL
ncbi:MAG: hypothetical protein ACREGI_00845 [Candidatus Levyibacteriota bacterium]